MRIYVAGSIHSVDAVRNVQSLLRSGGHHITFDWTGPEGEQRREWVSDPAAAERGAVLAQLERRAVQTADAVVAVLHPNHSQRGTHVELGMALAWRIPVFLLDHVGHGSVFWTLPEVHRVNRVELLVRLEEHSHGR